MWFDEILLKYSTIFANQLIFSTFYREKFEVGKIMNREYYLQGIKFSIL